MMMPISPCVAKSKPTQITKARLSTQSPQILTTLQNYLIPIQVYSAWRTIDLRVAMGQHCKTPCMSLLNITILLTPENVSSNIFTQPASQFRVLDSVPDAIQQ